MVGQYVIKLALNIISTHFGNLVTKVCECLLRKGTLRMPEIIRFTKLSHQQVQNCLLVLIQHNCIQAFTFKNEGDDEASVPKGTHYTVIFDNILHRMRFPKFLAIVLEQVDKECVELFAGLLQNGRLTLKQMIERAQEKQGDTVDEDAMRKNLDKLVYAHYVARCPKHVEITLLVEDNQKKKRGSNSVTVFVEPETIEQRAITASIHSGRFSPLKNTGSDVNSEASTSGKAPKLTVGEKRKIDDLEMDEGSQDEVLWRANFEEFVRHLRHKACVANVRSRLDDGAGIVLNAMLKATSKAGKKVKIETSDPLSSDAIFDEVIKSEEGRSMTLEYVKVALDQLDCNRSNVGEESYTADIKKLIEIAQNHEVESLVSTRYGKDAYTMFRLLSKHDRSLESEKIADTAFVDKKEAVKILYKLWKDDFLHMEMCKVNSYSQLLLWNINKRSVREHVFEDMCHAALNLRLRLAYELEQESELIELPKEKRIGPLVKRCERIQKVRVLLDSSLVKLDEALMLFHDF